MGEGSSAERVPPHSQEAEVAVLGAILLEPNAMSAVAPKLQAECFYRADHQKLYAAFADLLAKNQPIDVVSVREELKRMGEQDIAGNADLFVTLSGAVPSIANAEHYAEIVRQKFLLRTLIGACNESLVEAYDENQETSDILGRAEERIFNVATHYEATRPVEIKEIVAEVLDTIMEHPERLKGITTEFTDLDHWTGGLHRGEFVVIGGRPSTGKTTFAINLIERIGIRQGLGILMFSLEMSKQQIAQNLLCCNARMDSTPLRTGQLDKSQWSKIREAASNLYDAPVHVDDSSGLTVSDIRAKCRRMFAQHEIKLIIVDYLQLMSGERRGRDSSRLQEITDISRGLKGLAKEMKVPVIALSQLSRAAEGDSGARPKLSHLRESGAIEQDADVVLLLYRPEAAKEAAKNDQNGEEADHDRKGESATGKTELIIAKQRNGPTATVNLTFRANELRFENFSVYPAAQMGGRSPEGDDYDDAAF